MTTRPGFLLRLSVKTLGTSPINGLEEEPSVEVGEIRVAVKQAGRFLVLKAGDFETEADAEAFLPRLKGGLWNLAIEHNIAFVPFFGRRDITRPEDPYVAGRNLAESFNLIVEGPPQPVHGLTEEEGYAIFRTGEYMRFLGMGDFTAHVSTGWINAARTLVAGMTQIRPPAGDDADLATAIDLYLSSFYESSSRARFLTLMTALEVLAPVTDKHPTAVALLVELGNAIGARLANEADPEARDALEALKRETDFRRETSIRRRIRQLVLTEAPLGEVELKALAKRVVDAYDLRGAVVHGSAIHPNALGDASQTALDTVKLLLRSRLGLDVRQSQE